MGEEYGFETKVLGPALIDGEVVSSSAVRNLVREGNVKKASKFLGYHFYIEGQVKEGERRGTKIGFPTLNLDTDWDILPKVGVYATRAYIDEELKDSITNVGYRPTFGSDELLVETHVFDFDRGIYGKRVRVEFVDRVRDEKKFDGADALVEQIKKDVGRVKGILAIG